MTRCQQTLQNKTGTAKLHSHTSVLCLRDRRKNSIARHLHTSSSWPFPLVRERFLYLKPKHRSFIILAERKLIHFLKIFLPSLDYLFIYLLGHTTWHVGSSFPEQGLEPGPTAVKVPSPNYWTTREFPVSFF